MIITVKILIKLLITGLIYFVSGIDNHILTYENNINFILVTAASYKYLLPRFFNRNYVVRQRHETGWYILQFAFNGLHLFNVRMYVMLCLSRWRDLIQSCSADMTWDKILMAVAFLKNLVPFVWRIWHRYGGIVFFLTWTGQILKPSYNGGR